jgi:hypothetical protein
MNIKKENTPANNTPIEVFAGMEVKEADTLRTGMAIGILSLCVTILTLYALIFFIYTFYHPDVKAITDKITPLSYLPSYWFIPEPVERLQYQMTILILPFVALLSSAIMNKLSNLFRAHPRFSITVNVAGIAGFVVFIIKLMEQKLLYTGNPELTDFYFSEHLIGIHSRWVWVVLFFYILAAYFYLISCRQKATQLKKTITKVVCLLFVVFVAIDIFLYDRLDITLQQSGLGEINPVFYSITQVFAGKALLVNVNAQYGLYAWLLKPIFKLIGLSAKSFGLLMGLLNSISFLLLYLGTRKILKRELLSLFVFLCLVFWQFWQSRLQFVETHPYYQYWPIRMIFPAITFYLLALFSEGKEKRNKILQPMLALSAATGVLWNMDSGLVVFGAVLIAMVFSAYHTLPLKKAIQQAMLYSAYHISALIMVLLLYCVHTKMLTGTWPDFEQASKYQGIFYISGFFMLPMSAFHFWNVPALIYIVTSIYIIRNMRKSNQPELPVVVFLFVLGCGIFSYFQGRSYDLIVNTVMYPAIILAGVFCNRLYTQITTNKLWLHESVVLFMILFLFLADGAFSMIYKMPAIHEKAYHKGYIENIQQQKDMQERIKFMKDNLPTGDTVLVLSANLESYWYATGAYCNPMNIASSTEFFFKRDLDTIVNYIKTDKYPIIFDGCNQLGTWYLQDTLLEQLALHTEISKSADDHTIFLMKPTGKIAKREIIPTGATIYYNDLGMLNEFSSATNKCKFNDSYDIEFILSLDSSRLMKDDTLFSNVSGEVPFCGLQVQQAGDDETEYKFMYGNGVEWICPSHFRLSNTEDNHVLISMRKGSLTISNNGRILTHCIGKGTIKNSENNFYLDKRFPGIVKEIKIEDY